MMDTIEHINLLQAYNLIALGNALLFFALVGLVCWATGSNLTWAVVAFILAYPLTVLMLCLCRSAAMAGRN